MAVPFPNLDSSSLGAPALARPTSVEHHTESKEDGGGSPHVPAALAPVVLQRHSEETMRPPSPMRSPLGSPLGSPSQISSNCMTEVKPAAHCKKLEPAPTLMVPDPYRPMSANLVPFGIYAASLPRQWSARKGSGRKGSGRKSKPTSARRHEPADKPPPALVVHAPLAKHPLPPPCPVPPGTNTANLPPPSPNSNPLTPPVSPSKQLPAKPAHMPKSLLAVCLAPKLAAARQAKTLRPTDFDADKPPPDKQSSVLRSRHLEMLRQLSAKNKTPPAAATPVSEAILRLSQAKVVNEMVHVRSELLPPSRVSAADRGHLQRPSLSHCLTLPARLQPAKPAPTSPTALLTVTLNRAASRSRSLDPSQSRVPSSAPTPNTAARATRKASARKSARKSKAERRQQQQQQRQHQHQHQHGGQVDVPPPTSSGNQSSIRRRSKSLNARPAPASGDADTSGVCVEISVSAAEDAVHVTLRSRASTLESLDASHGPSTSKAVVGTVVERPAQRRLHSSSPLPKSASFGGETTTVLGIRAQHLKELREAAENPKVWVHTPLKVPKSNMNMWDIAFAMSHTDLAKSLAKRRKADWFRGSSQMAVVTFEDSCEELVGPASLINCSVSTLSLQDRLWPCNCKEEREAFWASSFSANPQFKYRHPVGAHELARFGVHTEYLPLATRILDSVMATYGSEKAYKAALEKEDDQAMTPDQLVKSAEEFLRECTGPYGPSLARRLNIHFKQRKANSHASIAVRGATLTVPLPITLTKARAPAVWAHELGTHFLRGHVNEKVRRNVASQSGALAALMNTKSSNYAVPVGGNLGWEDHQKRLEWVRANPWDPRIPRRLVTSGGSAQESSSAATSRPSTSASKSTHSDPFPVLEQAELPAPRQPPAETTDDTGEDETEAPGVKEVEEEPEAEGKGERKAPARPVMDESLLRPCTSTHSQRSMVANRQERFLEERADACSEEGLAMVNQFMYERDSRLWRPALMYFAAARGAELSFAELFAELGAYVQDGLRRWAICVRVKGGITDTEAKGAFCRDQVYFAGAVAVLKRRKTLDFHYMHSGKVRVEDGDRDGELAQHVERRRKDFTAPPHLNNLAAYLRRLDDLAADNFIDTMMTMDDSSSGDDETASSN